MEVISKRITVKASANKAFQGFINEIAHWWPKEYTWSQQELVDLNVEPWVGGLLSEFGPNKFRCDWGTVVDIREFEHFSFKWQISFNRSPVPDAGKASTVKITFKSDEDSQTSVQLEHLDFDKHGDHHHEYFEAMNSNKGWDLILQHYSEYVDK